MNEQEFEFRLNNLVKNPEEYSIVRAYEILKKGKELKKWKTYRFKTDTSLRYRTSPVVEFKEDKKNQVATLTMSFAGLFGANGRLPFSLSESIEGNDEELSTKEKDLFDELNHQVVSAYFNTISNSERFCSQSSNAARALEEHLLNLVGLRGFESHSGLTNSLIVGLAPLLCSRLSASSLAGIVSQCFGVGVKVHVQEPKANSKTQTITIQLGPLSRQAYSSLIPGNNGFSLLVQLLGALSARTINFNVVLVSDNDCSVPKYGFELGTSQLNWSSQLPACDQERVGFISSKFVNSVECWTPQNED